VDQIERIAEFQETLLDVALEAPSMDCAVAFERASKAFLLTGDPRFLDSAEEIASRLRASANKGDVIDDLERLRREITVFVRQGRRATRPRT
jgi:hypothetical protein